jgi:hypothetical protein
LRPSKKTTSSHALPPAPLLAQALDALHSFSQFWLISAVHVARAFSGLPKIQDKAGITIKLVIKSGIYFSKVILLFPCIAIC